MHKDISWSYAPYKPYFHETGDIYICRVAPSETAIHLEWLPVADTYEIYYRLRNTDTFTLYEATAGCACTITGSIFFSQLLLQHIQLLTEALAEQCKLIAPMHIGQQNAD